LKDDYPLSIDDDNVGEDDYPLGILAQTQDDEWWKDIPYCQKGYKWNEELCLCEKEAKCK